MVTRTQLSPVRFILFSFVLGTLVLATVPLILKSFETEDDGFGAVVIDEVGLDDGTTICLHGVTYGRYHNLDARFMRTNSVVVFETGYYNRSLVHDTYGIEDDKIVVWISRKDRDGRYMGLEWWSHCVITDANGAEIRDSIAQRHMLPLGSYNAEPAGKRPFKRSPYDLGNRQDIKQLIIGHSEFPRIRSQSDITIRIFDVSQKEVARFTVPNPTPQPTAKWTASSLPASKQVGDVTLRLKTLNARSQSFTSRFDLERTQTYQVTPEIELLNKDGERRDDYSIGDIRFFDLLENESTIDDVTLSFKEPVWRMEATMSRRVDKAPADEFIEFTEISIPRRNSMAENPMSFSNDKFELNVQLVSGRGKTRSDYDTSTHHHRFPPFEGMFYPQEQLAAPDERQPNGEQQPINGVPQGSFIVSFETGYRHATATFEGEVVMLRVDHVPLLDGQQLSVLATDDQGRDVEVIQQALLESNFWFFNALPDAKSLKIRALLQESEKFEFFVKPPAVPKALTTK